MVLLRALPRIPMIATSAKIVLILLCFVGAEAHNQLASEKRSGHTSVQFSASSLSVTNIHRRDRRFLAAETDNQARSSRELICSLSPENHSVGAPLNVYFDTADPSSRYVTFGNENGVEGSATCIHDVDLRQIRKGDAGSCPEYPCKLDMHTDSAGLQKSHVAMAKEIKGRCIEADEAKTGPVDVLMFGLGVGIVQSLLLGECPEGSLRFRSVELDSRMLLVASKYFGLPLIPGSSEVVIEEASDFARKANKTLSKGASFGERGYDVVVIDAFEGNGVTPSSVLSRSFLSNVAQLRKPRGLLMHHIWHENPMSPRVKSDYKGALDDYYDIFGEANVRTTAIPRITNAWDGFIQVNS